jgi:FAD/FMN-containing dehydrogenase
MLDTPNTAEEVLTSSVRRTEYYSADDHLNPACVFQPTSPQQLSYAVRTLAKKQTLFAYRGGGHMPIPGYNNINATGILITSAGLNQLQISADRSTVNVGPGNRWTDVYKYLEPYGLSAVGGRLGVVGVPGYLLGGGVSFFGNEYGWASANIASFTVWESTSTNTGRIDTNWEHNRLSSPMVQC